MSGPQIKIEQVTPQMASQLLGTMQGNRPVRPRMVARYAREMIAGKWLLNGESLKVSSAGHLIDGQHRLSAVIQAGVTVSMVIVRGVDASAMLTLDTGVSRTFHDATTIAGREWHIGVGAVARQWLKYDRGVTTVMAKLAPSHQELEEFILRHPCIPASAAFIKTLKIVTSRCTFRVQGFVHAFATEKYDRELADTFIQDLNDGAGLEKTSPIWALRNRLIDNSDRALQPEQTLALTIKAWNAWIEGEKMTTLIWRTGGERPEEFPKFTVDLPARGISAKQRNQNASDRAKRALKVAK